MLKPLADEVLEYATASTVSGLSVAPFQPFNAGDIVRLQSYVQFRVTTTGRIDPNTYRMRSFSAIGVSQGNNGCGYGLGPYGLTPYGCGLDIAQGPPLPPPDPYSLSMTGNLILGGQASAQPGATGIWVVGYDNNLRSSGVSYASLAITQPTYNPTILASRQHQSLISGFITAISVIVAPPGYSSYTLTVRMNINGVSQNGVSVVIPPNTITGMGKGLISFNVGDLMALEYTFTGSTGSVYGPTRVLISYVVA